MSLPHRAGRGIVAALLAGGTTIALAAPASAEGTTPSGTSGPAKAAALLCSGSACDHKDPDATGCSATSSTVDRASTSLGTIELRFSSACQTNWVRITGFPGGGQAVALDVEDTDRNVYVPFNAPATPGTHFGNMVFSPGSNCALGHVFWITSSQTVLIGNLSSSGC